MGRYLLFTCLGSGVCAMTDRKTTALRPIALMVLAGIFGLMPVDGYALDRANPIVLGLDADMSSGAARGGEAIRRGMVLAIDEINTAGGVLGRALTLDVRDHRGNPARGIDNIAVFAETEGLVAVFGGVHTPVALAEMDAIHESEILFLVPWAAGTPVVENGYEPNYVFRVSVRDQYAGGFLIAKALKRKFQKPGLLLERTEWGRSNEKAMQAALEQRGLSDAPVAWFNWGEEDLSGQIDSLAAAGVDVILLVSNAREGTVALESMAKRLSSDRLPIISHWGITGGEFFKSAKAHLTEVDLTFLQTYSFLDPPFPAKAKRVLQAYCDSFGACTSAADVIAPTGTAHAYDLVFLLKQGIEEAGTADRARVRDAMETLGPYAGLVRVYDPPFTPDNHDALDQGDFNLSRYDEAGAIIPLSFE